MEEQEKQEEKNLQLRKHTSAAVVPLSVTLGGDGNVAAATTEDEASATTFLEKSGLAFLAEQFRQAGFLSADDVLCLTPRKYKILGIESLGTQLRLERVISSAKNSESVWRGKRDSPNPHTASEAKSQPSHY